METKQVDINNLVKRMKDNKEWCSLWICQTLLYLLCMVICLIGPFVLTGLYIVGTIKLPIRLFKTYVLEKFNG